MFNRMMAVALLFVVMVGCNTPMGPVSAGDIVSAIKGSNGEPAIQVMTSGAPSLVRSETGAGVVVAQFSLISINDDMRYMSLPIQLSSQSDRGEIYNVRALFDGVEVGRITVLETDDVGRQILLANPVVKNGTAGMVTIIADVPLGNGEYLVKLNLLVGKNNAFAINNRKPLSTPRVDGDPVIIREEVNF